MVENAQSAFGRFLRALRLRRGLSLLDVSRLSEVTAYKVDKGTLSRFENGSQRLPLAATATLCRVYGVPVEVITERYELDRHVDQLDVSLESPSEYAEVHLAARDALLRKNEKWKAYALFREAAARAPGERQAASRIHLATTIRSLGFYRLALHEFESMDSTQIDERTRCRLLERRASCRRGLGEHEIADKMAADAVRAAREIDEDGIVAFGELERSLVAMEFGEYAAALERLRASSAAWRRHAADLNESQRAAVETSTLVLVAEAYRTLNEFEKAGRAARSAVAIARRAGMPRPVGFADFLLGDLEHRNGREAKAQGHWERAARIGAELDNHRLEFTARLFQYEAALQGRQTLTARALERKLERLAPWLPRESTAVKKFHRLKQ